MGDDSQLRRFFAFPQFQYAPARLPLPLLALGKGERGHTVAVLSAESATSVAVPRLLPLRLNDTTERFFSVVILFKLSDCLVDKVQRFSVVRLIAATDNGE